MPDRCLRRQVEHPLSGRGLEMEQRTRLKLRRLIELCLDSVRRGFMSVSRAAQTMEAAGAPFEVVCRVLMPFKQGVSHQRLNDRRMSQETLRAGGGAIGA
jgi:hypothetical protein